MGIRTRFVTIVVASGAVAAVAVGSASARGGNHGCDSGTGAVFSSHFFAAGDNIAVGFVSYTPTLGSPTDGVIALNSPSGGGGPTGLSCTRAVTTRSNPVGDPTRSLPDQVRT